MIRNALLLVMASAATYTLAVQSHGARDRGRTHEPAASAPLAAPAPAPEPTPSMRMAAIEALPDGRAVLTLTIRAAAPMSVPVFPAPEGAPDWLAYADVQRQQEDGTWTAPARGCCSDAVVERRLTEDTSLDVALILDGDFREYDPPFTARVLGRGALVSEPFVLDARACARDGCFERAEARANARLLETLRARGFTGAITRTETPARALVERLIELNDGQCGDLRRETLRALSRFRLTGDLQALSSEPQKSCYLHASLELQLDDVGFDRIDEHTRWYDRLKGAPSAIVPTPAGPAIARRGGLPERPINARERVALREFLVQETP